MKKLLFTALVIVAVFLPASLVQAKTPIKILLVPGHDNEIWGAQYGNIKEADMNLVLATQIYNILKKDKRFKVYITRDGKGYTKNFADYFSTQKEDILSFEENAKKEMQNKIDAVIHVHFNDYPRPNKWTIGEYKGFSIYMPDGQMPNSKGSILLADNIFKQLSKKYTTSTYEKELGGLISDQKLIALGSNDTLNQNVRSVLIEYGYIYRFRNSSMRHGAYKIMADLTVKGIKNYFFTKQ